MPLDSLTQAAVDAQRALAAMAREDYDVFANFVLRDERTGQAITQGWIHEAWTRAREAHDKVLIISFPEAGKTQQLCVGVPLWELGRNPRLRIAIISRTQGQAIDIVNLIRTYIETSPELHMVFPHLRRSTLAGARWNQTQLDIERPRGIKEPSVQAFGIDAGAITGKRVDRFVLDDVLDVRTTRTKAARIAVSKKFWSEVYNRRSEDARFLVIGNLWHPDDWYCELERLESWASYKFPVKVTADLQAQWGLTAPIGSPTWPERWSPEKIDQYECDLPRAEFERAYMCHVSIDEASPFKQADIDVAFAKGAELGVLDNVDELELRHNIRRLAKVSRSPHDQAAFEVELIRRLLAGDGSPRRARDAYAPERVIEGAEYVRLALEEAEVGWEELITITGVDPSKGTARDPSGIVTSALARSTGERYIVEMDRGWYEIGELVRRVTDQWQRWDSVVVFETVGMQDWGRQVLQALEPDMRVEKLNTTGARKASPKDGLPAFAHRFVRHQITVLNNGTLTEAHRQFSREATGFDPNSHPGDLLMAAWFCDHYAWRHTQRKSARVGVQVFG